MTHKPLVFRRWYDLTGVYRCPGAEALLANVGQMSNGITRCMVVPNSFNRIKKLSCISSAQAILGSELVRRTYLLSQKPSLDPPGFPPKGVRNTKQKRVNYVNEVVSKGVKLCKIV